MSATSTYDSSITIDKTKSSCEFCGKFFKSVKIHVSKAHPTEYRQSILSNYVSSIPPNEDEVETNTNLLPDLPANPPSSTGLKALFRHSERTRTNANECSQAGIFALFEQQNECERTCSLRFREKSVHQRMFSFVRLRFKTGN